MMIGPYRVIRSIGEGGMGVVYEAMNDAIKRRVAIKVLHPAFAHHKETLARFFDEARAVNLIDHPSLVQVQEHGQQADGTAYIVMEYLKGETLAQRLHAAGGQLQAADALPIVWQVAVALAVAHDKGIVHRDLKPSNLMLVPDPLGPGGERVKVLDFGIAKLAVGIQSARTASQTVMGTPAYMSPEQCRGMGAIDGKADVYSLGCILFELLSGKPPFCADEDSSPLAVLNMHLNEPIPLLLDFVPQIPKDVAALCECMLAKERSARPSMRELAEKLTAIQTAPSALDFALRPTMSSHDSADTSLPFARTVTPEAVSRISGNRRKWFLGIGALGLIAAAGTAWYAAGRMVARQRQSGSNPMGLGHEKGTAIPVLPLAYPCSSADSRADLAAGCPDGFISWCDPTGYMLACCTDGMVPYAKDGSCGCPPGGILATQLVAKRAGCTEAVDSSQTSRQRISPTMNQNMASVVECMIGPAQDNKDLQGGVSLKLALAADGSVFLARIQASSLPVPALQQCLVKLFQNIRFPPPPGGHEEFTYPISLLN